jgi:Rps23 Pro-64 3,4-dihydroxylase Tpa1-like proline 4-hydroxylase
MLKNFTITSEEYQHTKPYPYAFIDNYLDETFAKELQKEILSIPENQFYKFVGGLFEERYTLRENIYTPNLKQLYDNFTSEAFIKKLSDLTGYNLFKDPDKNFWGVNKYKSGGKLDVHVDSSVHTRTKQKKQVILGLYLSYNWKEEYGCELEIWEGENSKNNTPKLFQCADKIAPLFNRLLIFTNNDCAWHGTKEALCPPDSERIFIILSYFSDNKDFENHRDKAHFATRPDEPINPKKEKIRLLRADPEQYKEMYIYIYDK